MLTEHISTCKQSKYIFKKNHLLSHPLIHQMLHIEKKKTNKKHSGVIDDQSRWEPIGDIYY